MPCWKFSCSLFQNISLIYSFFNFALGLQDYKPYSSLKLQKFKKLKSDSEVLADKWDSDDDMGDHEF